MIKILTCSLSIILNASSYPMRICHLATESFSFKENTQLESDTTDYATLFVYRPKNLLFGPTYDIYIDDSEMSGKLFIKKIKGNTYREIKIYKEGEYTFWAKALEEKVSVKVNVKFGNSYYLRCGFSQGVIRNRPKLEFVDIDEGEKEFKNR